VKTTPADKNIIIEILRSAQNDRSEVQSLASQGLLIEDLRFMILEVYPDSYRGGTL
jgi:hypothetical protein